VSRGRRVWMRPYLSSLYKRRLDQGPEPERPRSVWINWFVPVFNHFNPFNKTKQ